MKGINYKKLIKRLVFALIAAALIWVFFLKGKTATSLVKRVELDSKIVTLTVSGSGEVKSKNEADLKFQSSGKINSLYVKQGDVVTKGQLLAGLDYNSQYLTAEALQDARDIAIRQRDLFTHDREDNIDLYDGEDAYNIKLREYNEAVDKAENSYQAQIASLNSGYIYAPFDGAVVDIRKKEGETAAVTDVVIKVVDLNQLYFEIKVDQEDFGFIKVGMVSHIELDPYEDVQFPAKVTKLPLFTDSSIDNDFIIELEITDVLGLALLTGMNGDAYIDIETTGSEVNVLTFDDVLYDDENNPYVWVIGDNKKVQRKSLEIGLEGDFYVEIKTPLEELENKIVAPAVKTTEIDEGFKPKFVNGK